MAVQPLGHYSLDEYLRLQDEPESERSEFYGGLISPVDSASPHHARLGKRIGAILANIYSSCAVYDASLNLYLAWANRIVHS